MLNHLTTSKTMDKLIISRRTELFLEVNEINLFLCPINHGLEVMMLGTKRNHVQERFDMIATMVVADNPEFAGCMFINYESGSNEVDVESYASIHNPSTLICVNGPKKDLSYSKAYYTLYKKGEKLSRKRILWGSTYYMPDDE